MWTIATMVASIMATDGKHAGRRNSAFLDAPGHGDPHRSFSILDVGQASTPLLLRYRGLVWGSELLEIGGERRDILIVELCCDHGHVCGAVLAVGATP